MEDGLFIFSPNSSFYYVLFTQAGFWVSFLILMGFAWYKRYPMIQWLAIVLCGRLGFLIGSRLGGFSIEDWSIWFQSSQMPIESSQSVWGGLLLGILSLLIARRILSFSFPVFSLYVIAVPLGLAVQRLGCLIAGCCFGTPTTLPIGVKYGIYSPAFDHHAYSGLLDVWAGSSLSIHPVPVYFMLAYLLCGFLMMRWQQKFPSEGTLVAGGIGILALSRFFIEFVRDVSTNPGMQGEMWMGVKYIQWLCLLIAMIGLSYAVISSLRDSPETQSATEEITPSSPSMSRWIFLFLLIGTAIWYFYPQFSRSDAWLILSSACILCLAQAIKWFSQAPTPVYRWGSVMLVIAATGWMSQTVNTNTIRQARLREKQAMPANWNSLQLGGGIGQYEEVYRNCDGAVTGRETFSYQVLGTGYRHHFNFRKYRRAMLGVDFGFGRERTDSPSDNLRLWGIGAFARYDFRWLGLGAGAYRGNLKYLGSTERWAPQTYVRIGPYDLFYMDGGTMNEFPSALTIPGYQIGFGTGLGRTDGTEVKAGLATNSIASGFYLSGRFIHKNTLVFNPYLVVGDLAGVGLKVEYILSNKFPGR